MKLFISADIEGCAGVALTDETHKKESVYQRFAEEMTEEVVAACEAAHEAGADEIVLGLLDFEILVAHNIIRQEARGQFASEREAAQRQRIDLAIRQRRGRLLQEALGKRPEYVQVQPGLFSLPAVLLDKVGRKADGLAEIMTHKPRHNGVKIDNDHRFLGFRRKQHVIDLGIVMGDAQGDFPGGKLVFDAAGKSAVKLMLKTWIKTANIQDVGAYFAVVDAKKELSPWALGMRVSSRGYMLGYQDLNDPSVSGFFRFLAKVGDNMMNMQIVRLEF